MALNTDAQAADVLKLCLTIEGASTGYAYLPFDVPAKATRITVRYDYPKSDTCIIDLGLGNPALTNFPSDHGLVGWSGGARDHVFVGCDAATPGYQPGITPGIWQIIFGLHRIPDVPIPITATVSFDFSPPAAAQSATTPDLKPRGPGWYCGDLHCHTDHSDAKGFAATLHATAQREGLDFLAVTDHNTTTAHPAYFDQNTSPDMVFVPAYEFTTERGHGNVFGARAVTDFRVRTDQDVMNMIGRIRAKGQLFSINHDKPNIPWQYTVPHVDCMEVWQAPWLAGNHISLQRYQARLSQGHRLTAIGGSDFHQPLIANASLATLARPCTFLWCAKLSIDGILDALRNGRSFVTEAPDGPHLMLNVDRIGHGGEIEATDTITLSYHARNAVGDLIEIWDANGCIATAPIHTTDQRGHFALQHASGFLRGQIVAHKNRQSIVNAAQAHVDAGRGGRLDWSSGIDHPILRSLTSPIYLI